MIDPGRLNELRSTDDVVVLCWIDAYDEVLADLRVLIEAAKVIDWERFHIAYSEDGPQKQTRQDNLNTAAHQICAIEAKYAALLGEGETTPNA